LVAGAFSVAFPNLGTGSSTCNLGAKEKKRIEYEEDAAAIAEG
jgi:hypothetical protein